MPHAFQPLSGAVPAAYARVDAAAWSEAAVRARESGCRLVALWGTDHRERDGAYSILAAYAVPQGLCVVELPIDAARAAYPDLSGIFPAASRQQRAARDLLGLVPENGGVDVRPWLRHGAWGEDEFPLRRDFDGAARRETAGGPYPFVRVEGDGVHEIAVGPIHAGTIEPGHFRFSVVGEKVLRLEGRLGYTHKGIDKRFEDFAVADGYRLAGRVSGDSTVAYAWAYAQAAESALAVLAPPRARWLRSLMLERERVANHLGDLGALGNDGGFGFALAQFMRLKEDWLRASAAAFGHRFMMDRIVPGGVSIDINREGCDTILAELDWLAQEFERLVTIYDENSSVEDRVRDAGILKSEKARELCAVGFVARASGLNLDCRIQHPFPPYDRISVTIPVLVSGDAHARAWVRVEEVRDSMRIIREILKSLPEGKISVPVKEPLPDQSGFAAVEGWRGEILYWVQSGPKGEINRCMVRDPSSVNWLGLEQCIHGNIVPDFPLCNKSFNQSYSGNDL